MTGTHWIAIKSKTFLEQKKVKKEIRLTIKYTVWNSEIKFTLIP